MAPEKEDKKSAQERKCEGSATRSPDWANGLRQLYDSVVDEPLPDSFNDLLAQFDEETKKNPSSKGQSS